MADALYNHGCAEYVPPIYSEKHEMGVMGRVQSPGGWGCCFSLSLQYLVPVVADSETPMEHRKSKRQVPTLTSSHQVPRPTGCTSIAGRKINIRRSGQRKTYPRPELPPRGSRPGLHRSGNKEPPPPLPLSLLCQACLETRITTSPDRQTKL